MAVLSVRKNLLITMALVAIFQQVGAFPKNLMSKTDCDCPENECCDDFFECGTTPSFCDWPLCQAGKCNDPPEPNDISLEDIVTEEFYDSIFTQNNYSDCEGGKSFYSRENFLEAARKQPLFARVGDENVTKRELAAFFAIALNPRLTHGFCNINSPNQTEDCSDIMNITYPCSAGAKYYGRGPLQVRWNYNYGPAGKEIQFDLLHCPDLVARNPVISFEASMWLWMHRGHVPFQQGFPYAVRAIYPDLCDGHHDPDDEVAIEYFKKFCNEFGVDPGDPLHC